MRDVPRVGVIGATGAVGGVLRELLARRGWEDVRLFASSRSTGTRLDGRVVEEATPAALGAGDFDLCFFAVSAETARELVPHAVAGGAVAIDKSSAFRMDPDVPLVVPEVNGDRALEHRGIVAVPNCSTIQLVCALEPIRAAAGLRRIRVATYQSVSGAGRAAMNRLLAEPPDRHDLCMDWAFDGEEFEEETKIRQETRRILELPELPLQATCVRVPVLVGHLQSVWVETRDALEPKAAREALAAASGIGVVELPTPAATAGTDDVLVGRIRRDPTVENGLTLLVAADNLRKGAALNAIQVAELLLARQPAVA